MFAGETSFAELLHLGQHGKATNEAFSPHFVQRGKVGVAEPCVPAPSIFPSVCGQADWPCNGEIKDIQSPQPATDLGEKTSLFVVHPHHPASDQNLKVDLVKLAAIDDICGEARDVVGVGE